MLVLFVFCLYFAYQDKNYYTILGVSRNANERQIKAAYRKLTLEKHPDKNKNNPRATEEFAEINNGKFYHSI